MPSKLRCYGENLNPVFEIKMYSHLTAKFDFAHFSTHLARVYQMLRCTRFLVRSAAATTATAPGRTSRWSTRWAAPAASPVDRVLQRATFRVRLRVVHLKAHLLEQWTYNRTTS